MTNPQPDLGSARIQLAEAMGWTQVERRNIKRGDKGYLTGKRPDAGNRQWGHRRIPDPFTCANDDYAVLEWARATDRTIAGHPIIECMGNALHHLIIKRRDPTANPENYGLNVEDVVYDYQVGDYARAALKVLSPTESNDD